MTIVFRAGRKPPTPAKPRLSFSQFSTAATAPPSADFISKVGSTNWPMYLNDKYGDCTIAAAGHELEIWSTYGRGSTTKITDAQVLTAYSAISGFNPKTGANDDGCVMQDVLNYWRKTGIGGTKILAFAEVKVSDLDECRRAIAQFGNLYLGINFPASAMDQFDAGRPWDVTTINNKVEGGHCINSAWYDTASGMWKVITWGAVQEMTQAFFNKYVEEAWVVVSDLWFDTATGFDPEGIDLSALGEQFSQITGEDNPFPVGPAPAQRPFLRRLLHSLWSMLTRLWKRP